MNLGHPTKWYIVSAIDGLGGIGKRGIIPWCYPEDLRFFKNITKNNVCIVGRKTWESLPLTVQNDTSRKFIVLSHSTYDPYDVIKLVNNNQFSSVFVIGGASIYAAFFQLITFDSIYITVIPDDHNCDTFFPTEYLREYYVNQVFGFNSDGTLCEIVNNQSTAYVQCYEKHICENNYIHLMKKVLSFGNLRVDRTGVGTKSLFGEQLKFPLKDQFPLIGSKKVFFKGVAEELLWFIKGQTNSKLLEEKGVNIWRSNTSKEFHQSNGLSLEEGSIGPGYGFQWRHFNAEYETMYSDYSNKGIDQLENIIHLIKTNPTSRRILMSAWNPCQIDQMTLPPCHILVQFYVHTDTNELSLHMYQRSADMFLGVPFNIASYALLCYIVANMCDLTPKELIISFGDVHIYKNHFEQCFQQINRICPRYPKLKIINRHSRIDDYVFDDFQLIDYNPLPTIKASMAV